VDLLLLRLAISEIELGLTAPKVVINEILEIAKVYSSQDSVAFINGLLDQWTKKFFDGKEWPE
jgi:N utilization substance protein B